MKVKSCYLQMQRIKEFYIWFFVSDLKEGEKTQTELQLDSILFIVSIKPNEKQYSNKWKNLQQKLFSYLFAKIVSLHCIKWLNTWMHWVRTFCVWQFICSYLCLVFFFYIIVTQHTRKFHLFQLLKPFFTEIVYLGCKKIIKLKSKRFEHKKNVISKTFYLCREDLTKKYPFGQRWLSLQ